MCGMGFGCVLSILATFICQIDPRYLLGLFVLQSMISFVLTFFIAKDEDKNDDRASLSVWGARVSVSVRNDSPTSVRQNLSSRVTSSKFAEADDNLDD